MSCRTLDDLLPSTLSATLPPKFYCPWNPAPSALVAPHAQYTTISPRPGALPLELLMEDGFFDKPMEDDCPTTDAPLGVTPCAEAMVVLMPVCKAVRMVDPTPAQKEEDNNALVG